MEFTQQNQIIASDYLDNKLPFNNINELVVSKLQTFKDNQSISNTQFVGSLFSDLSYQFFKFGISNRVIHGDIELFITCLSLSARSRFLSTYLHTSYGKEHPLSDNNVDNCLHVYELLKLLAINDTQAINAITQYFTPVATTGHSESLMLCNLVYAALGLHPKPTEAIDQISKKKTSHFYSALYLCIIAIMDNNEVDFLHNLQEVNRVYRHQKNKIEIEKIICIEVQAMINLWIMVNKSNLTSKISFDLPFDQALNDYVELNNPIHYPNFKSISPTLSNWLLMLPESMHSHDLANELKGNLFHFFARKIKVTFRNYRTKIKHEKQYMLENPPTPEPVKATKNTNKTYSKATDTAQYKMGAHVYHPIFGEGVISDIEGTGNNSRVLVDFKDNPRWLLTQFAKLEFID